MSSEAAARLLESGPNELPERKPPGLPRIFLSQFKSPFIYVLFATAVVSCALGQTINSFFIFVVLLINILIGAIQEYSAERLAAALGKLVPADIRLSLAQDLLAIELLGSCTHIASVKKTGTLTVNEMAVRSFSI